MEEEESVAALNSETPLLEEEEEEKEEVTPPHPVVVFLFKVLRFMLLPFAKVIFAPAAQRTVVKTTVMAVTISWIISTSIFAYVLFYNRHVPPITHVQPIWFQYDSTMQSGPHAMVNILSGKSVVSFHPQE